MDIIIFENEITKDTITKLINNINYSDSNEFTIYFSTEGGDIDYILILIDFINNSNKIINFVCFRDISSAGFILMLNLPKLKIKILNGTSAIIHLISQLIETRDVKNIDLTDLIDMNNDFLNKVQPFISKSDFKNLKNGFDVNLNCKQLKQIFEK